MIAKDLCNLTRPADLVCRCMGHDPHELLTLFGRRWRRVGPRLARHGHAVDVPRLMETMRLVRLIDEGSPEAFSVENWGRSHHLTSCPFSNRSTPLSRVSRQKEDRWERP